jgi:2-polyprenyl-6-methoxyphenol hydroxylase-like FAD-dependent oxidoreductase
MKASVLRPSNANAAFAPQAKRAHGRAISHAVVMGGGFAGLLAARVLSDHAERVTLLEQDASASESRQVRKGVPQGHHAHVLLQSGLESLRVFFPEIDQALEHCAGPAFDLMQETRWRIDGLFRPRFPSPYRAYAIGRPLLEHVVRQSLAALPTVSIHYGAGARGLVLADGRVVGVNLTDDTSLPADFVVDATGRGSRMPHWLAQLGWPEPESRRVTLGLSYTSFEVEAGASADDDYRLLLLPPNLPDQPCGGLVTPLHDGRQLVTLVSYGDERPPLEWAGFRRFAITHVHDAAFTRLLERCRPIGRGRVFQIPAQEWRRYDRLSSMPHGLVVVGDAMCTLDPAFGQGMSVSALEARELARLLEDRRVRLDDVPGAFHRAAARLLETPWSMGRGSRPDSASVPAAKLSTRVMRAYRRALMRAGAESHTVHRAFTRVVHLEADARSLMAPSVLLRVLALAFARVFVTGRLRRTLGGGTPRAQRTLSESQAPRTT